MYAAKYYMLRFAHERGDPGIFDWAKKIGGGIAGIAKSGLGVVSKFVPGPIGMGAGLLAKVMPSAGPAGATGRSWASMGSRSAAGMAQSFGAPSAGAFGGFQEALGLAGPSAGRGGGRRYRRLNPLNPRAARRAIRRIKAVRKMTQEIERQLPKRRAAAPTYAFQRRRKAAA